MRSRFRWITPVVAALAAIGLAALVLVPIRSLMTSADPVQAQRGEQLEVTTQQLMPPEVADVRRKIAVLVDEGAAATDIERAAAELAKLQVDPTASADAANGVFAPLVRPITFWEDIDSCGFYPQETRLECVIEVKQNFGYGSLVGTHESVLFCVDWNHNGRFDVVGGILGGASIESEGEGRFHVMDRSPVGWPNQGNANPPWRYAVYRDIDPPPGMVRGDLRTTPGVSGIVTYTDRPTLKVRAILAWLVEPTNCNYRPLWGDVFEFQIRMDPVR